MGNEKKVKVEEIEPLVSEYKGNVAAIARRFGVSRGTIWNRINESSNLRAALDDARETMIDNAESKLYAKVVEGDSRKQKQVGN
jgi:transposase-like protein